MAIDSEKARRKIEAVRDLPTLPKVATEIIAMANSPKTNAADVGHMIEQDQALTGKVLKLVNSAYYGFPGQIKTIQHAVVIIGFSKVKNVVVTASVFDLTKGRKSNRLDIPAYWRHCLGVAIGAKVAAGHLGGALSPEDAFVGGLLHDLGKLILDQFLPVECEPVYEKVRADGCLLTEAEKAVLGFTHAVVGGWIGENWKLPRQLQAAMRQHHEPAKAREDREMVMAVHLGDVLARALGVGNGGDYCVPEIEAASWTHFSLTAKFLDEALAAMLAEIAKAKQFFEMIDGNG